MVSRIDTNIPIDRSPISEICLFFNAYLFKYLERWMFFDSSFHDNRRQKLSLSQILESECKSSRYVF